MSIRGGFFGYVKLVGDPNVRGRDKFDSIMPLAARDTFTESSE